MLEMSSLFMCLFSSILNTYCKALFVFFQVLGVSLELVWFIIAGFGLSWAQFFESALFSLPVLVWCHCGLPLGGVAPLDWWCWQNIGTMRQRGPNQQLIVPLISHDPSTSFCPFVTIEGKCNENNLIWERSEQRALFAE